MLNPVKMPLPARALLTVALYLLLLINALPAHAQTGGEISARLDRAVIYEGETVKLSVRAENLAGMQQPDFSILQQNFEVSGTSQSSSISIINGRSSASQTWSVQLRPRRNGKIEIPPIPVGNRSTQPLSLEIRPVPLQSGKPRQGQPLFITLEIDSDADQFYVQQHIPLVVKLYFKHEITQGTLTDPRVEGATLERLGEDSRYSSQYNGENYSVFERRYSLIAEKSGKLKIPSALFQGYMDKPQTHPGNQGRYDPFSSFFSQSPLLQQGQPVSARSDPLQLEIKSHPNDFDGQQWLPAENLLIEDSWTSTPPSFRVGEPVSRTITVMAQGLMASQIPPLSLPAVSSFRRYAEPAETENRTDGKTVYGVSRRTFTYIPTYSGAQTIPEIEVKWWDVNNGKQQVASLPAWDIMVEADISQQADPAPGSTPLPTASSKNMQDTPTNAGSSQTDSTDAVNPPGMSLASAWQWLNDKVYWLGAVILAVILLLWVTRRKSSQPVASPAVATDDALQSSTADPAVATQKRQLLAELEQACQATNAQQVARLLLQLARLEWPDDPPMSLSAVAQRIEVGREALQQLDRFLYSSGGSWQSNDICRLFGRGFSGQTSHHHDRASPLPPLYPEN